MEKGDGVTCVIPHKVCADVRLRLARCPGTAQVRIGVSL